MYISEISALIFYISEFRHLCFNFLGWLSEVIQFALVIYSVATMKYFQLKHGQLNVNEEFRCKSL